MCFCWSCVAGVAQLACLLAFSPPPPPPSHIFLGKYQFHTLVFPVQCCVDRCLEVGCGSVAMVTSLLLRRLLPSSVATFKAPTLQYSIGLEFKLEVNYMKLIHFLRIWWGIQGGLQGHCHVLLLELRCWSCSASLLACFLPPPPSHIFLGKYQFHTLVFPVQCCVDRCLEVGCGSVAMVTSLLLRRLLPSSVATFKAPTLQYSIGLEFKLEVNYMKLMQSAGNFI